MNTRKYIDCRDVPNDMNCSLRISGTEDEVAKAAFDHAVSVHGAKGTIELKAEITKWMKDEAEDMVSFMKKDASHHAERLGSQLL